jgi:predicted N-formylglutamate amidohydrolase
LGPSDPSPYLASGAGAESPYLFVCDHAGRTIPACLDSLDMEVSQMDRHIAWDIGAGEVASRLGEALGAFVIRQTYSRLVVDCNRAVGRDDMFPVLADGAAVPGNEGLDDPGRQARLDAIYTPYHDRIAAELDARASQPTVVVSVHSFTPAMNGAGRPWHIGVLHDGTSAGSLKMLELLRAEPDLVVGDNQPYAMDGVDYTIPHHAIARGWPYLELEIRQDLIAAPEGQDRFAALLARLIPQAFAA